MDLIHNPHDQFYKQIFGQPDVAADYLQNYLPQEITEAIDLQNLLPIQESFIDTKLKESSVDLLFQTRFKNEPAFIYILFEHKSYNDPLVAFQLLRYMVRIWERHLKENPKTKELPVIFPLLFYHGESGWAAPVNFQGLFNKANTELLGKYIPNYEYFLADLSQLPEDQIRGGLTTQAAILLMKSIFDKNLHEKVPEIIHLLYQLHNPKEKTVDLIYRFLYYIFVGARNADPVKINEVIAKTGKVTEDIMATMAEELIQKGRIQGREEGREEGREAGREEGREVGREEERRILAKRLYDSNIAIDVIAATTGLSEEEIKSL